LNVAHVHDTRTEDVGEYRGVTYIWPDGREEIYPSDLLREKSMRLAGAFRNLGLAPGDRVALTMPNSPLVGVSYQGVLRSGLVIVPMLFLLSAKEINHILVDSEASAFITSAEFTEKAQEAVAGTQAKLIVAEGAPPPGALSFDELCTAEPAEDIVEREDSDLAMLIYTGGTTGRSKGVMITHGNMWAGARSLRKLAEQDGREAYVGLGVLPLSHAYGVLMSLDSALSSRGSILLRWFSPELFLSALEKHRATATALVPAMMAMLLACPDAGKRDTSSLKLVSVGSAPCPADLIRAFEEKFGCTVAEGYGLSESIAALSTNLFSRRKLGTVGPPLPGVEVAIFDDEDNPLPVGQVGEVVCRGPQVMAGYWKAPEETAAVLRDGWLHTADLGHLDEDGYITIVDRKRDLIIRGGFNVFPTEVEEVLLEHPAVAEAAVVGVSDPVYGEEVVAVVAAKPGADLDKDALIAFARSKLASYKAPRAVVVVDALPRSSIMKILRREAREIARHALEDS